MTLSVEETTDVESVELDRLLQELRLPSMQLRIKLFLTGVIFPIACFAAAYQGMEATSNSPWQSGHIEDYLAMLVSWPGFAPLLPVICFSMFALAAWVIRPRLASHRWIRLGIYSGVILSVPFLICLFFTTAIATVIAAVFVAPVLALIVYAIFKSGQWAKRFTILHLMVLTAAVAITIAGLMATQVITGWEDIAIVLIGIGFAIVTAAPTLTVVTFARASAMVAGMTSNRNNNAGSLLDGYGIATVVAWFVAWLISWKFTVDVMLTEYAKLPVTDPNCYVSAAAARGHRQFVKRRPVNGGYVNQQMQRLKFIEFALAAACPRLHGVVRRIYNRFGPVLATRCASNLWCSDATYVALKPIEWIAECVRIAARVPRHEVERLYLPNNDST
ncbi:MAG: DUF6688 family protein [Pirellulaceae bacterium]